MWESGCGINKHRGPWGSFSLLHLRAPPRPPQRGDSLAGRWRQQRRWQRTGGEQPRWHFGGILMAFSCFLCLFRVYLPPPTPSPAPPRRGCTGAAHPPAVPGSLCQAPSPARAVPCRPGEPRDHPRSRSGNGIGAGRDPALRVWLSQRCPRVSQCPDRPWPPSLASPSAWKKGLETPRRSGRSPWARRDARGREKPLGAAFPGMLWLEVAGGCCHRF